MTKKKTTPKKTAASKPAARQAPEGEMVRALVSFVATVGELKFRPVQGQILRMPAGADWVWAGLAEPVDSTGVPETAAIAPSENALSPAAAAKPKKAAAAPVPADESGEPDESDEAEPAPVDESDEDKEEDGEES